MPVAAILSNNNVESIQTRRQSSRLKRKPSQELDSVECKKVCSEQQEPLSSSPRKTRSKPSLVSQVAHPIPKPASSLSDPCPHPSIITPPLSDIENKENSPLLESKASPLASSSASNITNSASPEPKLTFTQEEMNGCLSLLTSLQKHSAATPFLPCTSSTSLNNPVLPINLKTIEHRLQAHFYQHPKDFFADVFAMFHFARPILNSDATLKASLVKLESHYLETLQQCWNRVDPTTGKVKEEESVVEQVAVEPLLAVEKPIEKRHTRRSSRQETKEQVAELPATTATPASKITITNGESKSTPLFITLPTGKLQKKLDDSIKTKKSSRSSLGGNALCPPMKWMNFEQRDMMAPDVNLVSPLDPPSPTVSESDIEMAQRERSRSGSSFKTDEDDADPDVDELIEKASTGSSVTSSHRCCAYCGVTKTPMWRHGPPHCDPLCNGCGVKWKRGRILLEYPLASATSRSCVTKSSEVPLTVSCSSASSAGSSSTVTETLDALPANEEATDGQGGRVYNFKSRAKFRRFSVSQSSDKDDNEDKADDTFMPRLRSQSFADSCETHSLRSRACQSPTLSFFGSDDEEEGKKQSAFTHPSPPLSPMLKRGMNEDALPYLPPSMEPMGPPSSVPPQHQYRTRYSHVDRQAESHRMIPPTTPICPSSLLGKRSYIPSIDTSALPIRTSSFFTRTLQDKTALFQQYLSRMPPCRLAQVVDILIKDVYKKKQFDGEVVLDVREVDERTWYRLECVMLGKNE